MMDIKPFNSICSSGLRTDCLQIEEDAAKYHQASNLLPPVDDLHETALETPREGVEVPSPRPSVAERENPGCDEGNRPNINESWTNSSPQQDSPKGDSKSGNGKLEDPVEGTSSNRNGTERSGAILLHPPNNADSNSKLEEDPEKGTSFNYNSKSKGKIASSSKQLDELEKSQLDIVTGNSNSSPIKVYLPTCKSHSGAHKHENQKIKIIRDEQKNKTIRDESSRSIIDEENVSVGDVFGAFPDPPTDDPVSTDDDYEQEPEFEDLICYNPRALGRTERTYQLQTFKNKILFIFHTTQFEGNPNPRNGDEADVSALQHTFENCGFKVCDRKNKDKASIFAELSLFLEKDNISTYGCIAVAILTHGDGNGVLVSADNLTYTDCEILELFKIVTKPVLVTKPVVLIIQACRGTDDTVGIPVQDPNMIREDSQEKMTKRYYLPVECDTLVFHSSYVGKPAYRQTSCIPNFRLEAGTWFIRTLCEEINRMRETHDLLSIFSNVQTRVAVERNFKYFDRELKKNYVKKQMPVVTTTLIRKLYLLKFGETLKVPEPQPILRLPAYDEVDRRMEEQCRCFVRHFNYMTRCLRYYVSDSEQSNGHTECLLDMAKCQNEHNLGSLKTNLEKISEYLKRNARDFPSYKYMYLLPDQQKNLKQ